MQNRFLVRHARAFPPPASLYPRTLSLCSVSLAYLHLSWAPTFGVGGVERFLSNHSAVYDRCPLMQASTLKRVACCGKEGPCTTLDSPYVSDAARLP